MLCSPSGIFLDDVLGAVAFLVSRDVGADEIRRVRQPLEHVDFWAPRRPEESHPPAHSVEVSRAQQLNKAAKNKKNKKNSLTYTKSPTSTRAWAYFIRYVYGFLIF